MNFLTGLVFLYAVFVRIVSRLFGFDRLGLWAWKPLKMVDHLNIYVKMKPRLLSEEEYEDWKELVLTKEYHTATDHFEYQVLRFSLSEELGGVIRDNKISLTRYLQKSYNEGQLFVDKCVWRC